MSAIFQNNPYAKKRHTWGGKLCHPLFPTFEISQRNFTVQKLNWYITSYLIEPFSYPRDYVMSAKQCVPVQEVVLQAGSQQS